MAKGEYELGEDQMSNGYSNGTVQISNEKYTSTKDGQPTNGDQETEKKKEPEKTVGILEVFRFADTKDKLLMFLGTICACGMGACQPVMMILFGQMTDLFVDSATFDNWLSANMNNVTAWCGNITEEYIKANMDKFIACLAYNNQTEVINELDKMMLGDMMDQMQIYAVTYTIIGSIVIGLGYVEICFWRTASYRQAQRIRTKLFWSILRQEIGWFDTHEPGELNTRLSDDVNKIQDGIGEKLALFFQFFSAFIAGFVIGFIFGWELTLVILAVSPLLAISAAAMGQMDSIMTKKELKAYAKAGAVAEEVLSSIRTVTAFGGQKKECERYNSNLLEARDFGTYKGLVNGGGVGLIFFIMFCTYALAFWYGGTLVREGSMSAGDMLTVFFSVLTGAFSIGQAAPNLQYFATARGAAFTVFQIIDSEPQIDSSSEEGLKPDDFVGNIEFKNVVFNYPSRRDVPVLQGLNLRVDVGQTVALVGASGCGKSTVVQLIQRFYDIKEGEVLIGGINVKDLNVKWLRQHIGVVSQEPVLFATTIAQNIIYGRESVTMEEIEAAAKEANAHDFIMTLPKRYNTMVGERGAQLSGGQKQRIAIARALVRNPKVILLDEATSALDTESEATVQVALDKARMGRTTIVIAHRLSTVKTADIIAGFKDGVIVEKGTHEELMQVGGIYHQLVTNQTKKTVDGDYDLVEDEEELMGNGFGELKRALSVESNGVKYRKAMSVSSDKGRDRASSISSTTKEEVLPEPQISRVMKMNSSEWPYILLGCIGAIASGSVQPLFAILFSNILGVFSELDLVEQEKKINQYCVFFLILGIIAGVAMFLQSFMFARSGETLTKRLREKAFWSMMRQEISFFDDDTHNTGALCTRLATDASAVQGATGARLGSVIGNFASIAAGLAIGFYYSWKLTLLLLAFAPFMVISGFIEMRLMMGNASRQKDALEAAGKVSAESIENIRTVATLTKEETFYKNYNNETSVPYNNNLKSCHFHGMAYGFSQGVIFYAFAASFMFGAYLVNSGELLYENMFKVFSAIVFGAMSVGQASSFAPDYGKAKVAASRMFALFDRIPEIDNFSNEGLVPENMEGSALISNAFFNYPTRPNIPVLRGLNLSAAKGRMIALVGSSGCGKSTVVQLLERFYDLQSGEARVDSYEIRSLHVQALRSHQGLVSQEPILFGCSIRANIAYGDNSREVSMDEIIEASKMANIHNFITTLPLGYETSVGDKGAQLSGGQKQRVAIARALIRNPKVMLLDEATSALDTESEKVVQEALDKAQEGRTSIVIAHRLSTIQNADCIMVIQNGRVTEMGKHNELLSKKGFYYKLNNTQAKTT